MLSSIPFPVSCFISPSLSIPLAWLLVYIHNICISLFRGKYMVADFRDGFHDALPSPCARWIWHRASRSTCAMLRTSCVNWNNGSLSRSMFSPTYINFLVVCYRSNRDVMQASFGLFVLLYSGGISGSPTAAHIQATKRKERLHQLDEQRSFMAALAHS